MGRERWVGKIGGRMGQGPNERAEGGEDIHGGDLRGPRRGRGWRIWVAIGIAVAILIGGIWWRTAAGRAGPENTLGAAPTEAELDRLCAPGEPEYRDHALRWATVWYGRGTGDGDGNGGRARGHTAGRTVVRPLQGTTTGTTTGITADGKGRGGMGATVRIGDKRTVNGIKLTVVEVQHATDADGKVTFATGGGEIKLTVEKAKGEALASVTDPLFTAFVLRADADQTGRMGSGLPEVRAEGEGLFGVGVQHPALGERIGALTELPVNETITIGWKCPEITIKHNGVTQEGAHATFVLRRRSDLEDGGIVEHWYGADRFKGLTWSEEWQSYVAGDSAQGEWETDADGIVRQNYGDGSGLYEIYFPNGDGALFQRKSDPHYDGAEPPSEYAEDVWCYYKGLRVRVSEGLDVEIDIATGSIAATGQAGCRVIARLMGIEIEGSPGVLEWESFCDLDGGGGGTITDLRPGRYVVMQRVDSGDGADWHYICKRQWANVERGETTTVNMGLMEEPEPGHILGYVYLYGADLAEVDLYRSLYHLPGSPVLIASGSRLEYDWVGGAVIIGQDTARIISSDIGAGGCWECALAASFVFLDEGPMADANNMVWWSGNDQHRDLPTPWPLPIARESSGYIADVPFYRMRGGIYSGPCLPHGEGVWWQEQPPLEEWMYYGFVPPGPPPPGSPEYTWDIIEESGAIIDPELLMALDVGWQYDSGLLDIVGVYGRSRAGVVYTPPLRGGKVSGDCVEGHEQLIGHDKDPEAARLGIEWGETGTAVELRVLATPTDPTDQTRAMAVRNGNVCPYCLGPVWRAPSAGSYIYGFCTQSTCGNDARPYLRTPTLAAGAYDCRAVRYAAGKRSSIKLTRWLRPVNYIENDDYLQLYHGYPRWVAQHPTLASWGEGGFTDGDDAAEIVSTNGLEEGTGLYVQPKILPADIAGDADYIIRCTNPDGKTRDKRAHLNVGRKDPLRLTRARKTGGADGDNPSAFDWISDIYGIDSEEPGFNSFAVVGESPALVMGQTPVANTADTPWACQFQVRCGEPHHDVDGAGRIWRALNDEGTIRIHVRESPQRPWVERAPAFDEALEYCHPCILRMNDGRLMVCATVVGGKTRWRRSCDDGRHWEVVAGANVLANDLSCGVAVQMVGIILAAGYDDGTIYFELSNDNGVTTDTLRNGRTRAAIAQGDEAQPSLMVLFTGEILASITRGTGGVTYVSRDWGEHWTAVDQVV